MPEGVSPKPIEHLREGVRPIMTCVGTREDFDFRLDHLVQYFNKSKSFPAHNIDYDAPSYVLNKNDFLNGGDGTYVISIPDSRDKFSQGYINCTGLIIAGIKKNGEKVSILSHQDPDSFLSDTKEDFVRHLQERLQEILKICQPGTIDAVVVGGNYLPQPNFNTIYKQHYLDSISLISREVEKILGFNPRVENGPKVVVGGDDLYFDNENRRLYFLRRKVNPETGSFTQATIDEEKNKWGNN